MREYKPYNGRNPRTGRARARFPRSACPSSRSGKELKELVNAGQGTIETDDDDDDDDDEGMDDDEG